MRIILSLGSIVVITRRNWSLRNGWKWLWRRVRRRRVMIRLLIRSMGRLLILIGKRMQIVLSLWRLLLLLWLLSITSCSKREKKLVSRRSSCLKDWGKSTVYWKRGHRLKKRKVSNNNRQNDIPWSIKNPNGEFALRI